LSKAGIVAALAAEARLLGRARPQGTVLALPDGTLLAVSGMGPSAAADAAQRLLEAGSTALVSFGVAGGLDPALEAGALVLPDEVISAEGSRHATAAGWRELVAAAVADRYQVHRGALLTCREPLCSPADKASAFRETGAIAVDMEGFAIAEIAANRELPFLAVRSVLDAAADTLPPTLLGAIDMRGAASTGRLLAAILRAPREWPAVLQLALRCRAAARPLVSVARSGVLASPVSRSQTPARPASGSTGRTLDVP
jgi:adenosylhomocysteine nucleosidase